MQNIVICGGTSGFGKAMANEFMLRNNNVIVCGRNLSKLQKLDKNIITYQCDVKNYKHIEKLASYANYIFQDKTDHWINSAALCEGPIDFDKLELDEIKTIIATNLLGTIYGCKVAIDNDAKNIYNISGHGSQGGQTNGFPVYGLCKSGIQQFTNTISKEHKNIHTIAPGLMKTKLTKNLFEDTPYIELFSQTPETVAASIVPKILKINGNNQLIMF